MSQSKSASARSIGWIFNRMHVYVYADVSSTQPAREHMKAPALNRLPNLRIDSHNMSSSRKLEPASLSSSGLFAAMQRAATTFQARRWWAGPPDLARCFKCNQKYTCSTMAVITLLLNVALRTLSVECFPRYSRSGSLAGACSSNRCQTEYLILLQSNVANA